MELEVAAYIGEDVHCHVHELIVLVILLDDVAIGVFPASLVFAYFVIGIAAESAFPAINFV